ncbi:MAG: STAS domain-containing protein [bacterium]|nr:STAS domain-containing protein [bacterium]MBU1918963.1 STAS domain-containing protein [bacterium]
MDINVKKQHEVAIVGLTGSLDVSVQQVFKDKLVTASHAHENDVVLDFSQVTFIDSSCLGTLVSLAKNLRENKGDIKLSNLRDDVRSIFQITRLDRVFEIFENNEEAVDSFYKKTH